MNWFLWEKNVCDEERLETNSSLSIFSFSFQFLFWEHFWFFIMKLFFQQFICKERQWKKCINLQSVKHTKREVSFTRQSVLLSMNLVLTIKKKKKQWNHFRKNSFNHRKIYFNKWNYNQKWNVKVCYLHSSIHERFLPNIYSQSSNK